MTKKKKKKKEGYKFGFRRKIQAEKSNDVVFVGVW